MIKKKYIEPKIIMEHMILGNMLEGTSGDSGTTIIDPDDPIEEGDAKAFGRFEYFDYSDKY
jgi:hypothetical protein